MSTIREVHWKAEVYDADVYGVDKFIVRLKAALQRRGYGPPP